MKELAYAFWMLVGTYTGGDSEGIYVYGFDPATARTELVGMARVENPSYMTVSADGSMVYAVSENGGGKVSRASALKFDRATGALTPADSEATGGEAPCNIATNGRVVVTANYGGGDISVFAVEPDGRLSPLRQSLRLPSAKEGSDPAPSHMHCVKFSPDGRYLFAADLGRDRIARWDVRAGEIGGRVAGDGTGDVIDAGSLKTFDVPPGSGPRHFVFDHAGRNLYLINEKAGTVIAFRYSEGDLEPFRTVQADTAGGHGSADIVLTPDGRHLYASNRLKYDGVAIFSVSPGDGTLSPAGYRTTGIHPRGLSVSPGGGFLAVASRDSDTVEFFAIDPDTGALSPAPAPAETISLDRPVCVTFIAVNR
jgi:6-phosphogluconolactonase (cycloisomerase 2 family)